MENGTSYDLVAEAKKKFGDLSVAEEKVLTAVKVGEPAYCGPSQEDKDPANDPAKAAEWDKSRIVRAKLLRWLIVDLEASKQVDPRGVRIHAARIGDVPTEDILDFGAITIAFPLLFCLCSFDVPIRLDGATTKTLNLQGSYVTQLSADGIVVDGALFLRSGFRSQGMVRLLGAQIGGNLECAGATFFNKDGAALNADGIKVRGNVFLRDGFSVQGNVRLPGADIGGQFDFSRAKFAGSSVVNLENATVKQGFLWRGLDVDTPVQLNLSHASVGPIADDDKSWPAKGKLLLDGFVYQRIDSTSPTSAEERLHWLGRQPDGFIPQPYRQLAKVLREAGDDAGARKVLIAMENARLKHGKLSRLQKIAQWVLGVTVGYGYRPFRALGWILGFVLLGTVLFSWGQNAGAMTTVRDSLRQAEPFNAFIYSLESFLPLVDLKMAKHWLPDPSAKASEPEIFNYDVPTPTDLGKYLRWYLWLHILAGYFFATMFAAGITGIVRRE